MSLQKWDACSHTHTHTYYLNSRFNFRWKPSKAALRAACLKPKLQNLPTRTNFGMYSHTVPYLMTRWWRKKVQPKCKKNIFHSHISGNPKEDPNRMAWIFTLNLQVLSFSSAFGPHTFCDALIFQRSALSLSICHQSEATSCLSDA